jgi:hypothetical protein
MIEENELLIRRKNDIDDTAFYVAFDTSFIGVFREDHDEGEAYKIRRYVWLVSRRYKHPFAIPSLGDQGTHLPQTHKPPLLKPTWNR